MGTQHQHSHIWIFGGNHLGRLNAVHVGHADIHDHQVRTLLLQPGKSFASCRCLGDYDDVRFRIQDLSQAFPEKDHVLFREGLAQILDTEPDIIIVAQASTGREALSRLKEKGANLVVMDISMPDMDGIEATKMIASEYPNVAVLVLSAHEDSKSLFSSIEAGARGYLLKDSAPMNSQPPSAKLREVVLSSASR